MGYLQTYSQRQPAGAELTRWFSKPDPNLGIGLIYPENIISIDIDDKNLFPLVSKLRPEEKAKQTIVDETPRGFRIFLKVPRGIITKKIEAKFPGEHRGIELKPGGQGYVIVPPTRGYRRLSPDDQLQELNADEARILLETVELYGKYARLIDRLAGVWLEGARHGLAGALAGALRKQGLTRAQVETIVEAVASLAGDVELDDRLRYVKDTFEKPPEEVAGVSKLREILVNVMQLEEAEEIVAELKPPQGEEEKEEIEKPKVKVSGKADEGYYEAIMHNGQPAFLVYSNGKFKILDRVHEEGLEILPPKPESYPYLQYEYTEEDVEPKQLAGEILSIFRQLVDVNDGSRKRWTVETVKTYHQEKLNTTPYEHLVGPEGTGKSTVQRLFSLLAYRPLYGVSIPEADVYAYLEQHPFSVIIEDEIQGLESNLEKMKIYLSGYKQGARIPRVTILSNGERRIDYFPCFGFKMVAGRRLVNNPAFLDRCIVTRMVEGYPENDEITPETIEACRKIRNKLLKLRLIMMEQSLPEAEPPAKGRIKELWKPVFQVAKLIGFEEDLKQDFKQHYLEYRRGREESIEAAILKAYLKAVSTRGREWVSNDEIWNALTSMLDGQNDEKKPHIYHSSEFGDISKSLVGRRLSEGLGGEQKKIRSGGTVLRAWGIPFETLRKQVKRYICEHIDNFNPVEKSFSCPYGEPGKEGITCRNEVYQVENSCRLAQIIDGITLKPCSLLTASIKEETKPE
jgi:hypothetical protein